MFVVLEVCVVCYWVGCKGFLFIELGVCCVEYVGEWCEDVDEDWWCIYVGSV